MNNVVCFHPLVVKQCVLNYSQGFWLLLDALAFTFNLCISMKSEVARIEGLNQPLIRNDFDLKLLEFKLRMNLQMISNF